MRKLVATESSISLVARRATRVDGWTEIIDLVLADPKAPRDERMTSNCQLTTMQLTLNTKLETTAGCAGGQSLNSEPDRVKVQLLLCG